MIPGCNKPFYWNSPASIRCTVPFFFFALPLLSLVPHRVKIFCVHMRVLWIKHAASSASLLQKHLNSLSDLQILSVAGVCFYLLCLRQQDSSSLTDRNAHTGVKEEIYFSGNKREAKPWMSGSDRWEGLITSESFSQLWQKVNTLIDHLSAETFQVSAGSISTKKKHNNIHSFWTQFRI